MIRNLPGSFDVRDEWYEFDTSPRPHVRVLARADESTYKPNKPMGDHPIIWTNENYRRASTSASDTIQPRAAIQISPF